MVGYQFLFLSQCYSFTLEETVVKLKIQLEIRNVNQVVGSSVLQGMKGEAPVIGEDRVAGGMDEDGLFPKYFPHVQEAGDNLEPHPIYEHRGSCCTTTTNSNSSCGAVNTSQL